MTDFFNKLIPVTNPDANGLYDWIRIMAGGASTFNTIDMKGDLTDKNGDVITGGSSTINPVGSVISFAGAFAPDDWLMCDGAAVNRIVYEDLFAEIGIVYGPGDGITTFNVPDLRGRAMVTVDSGAGRITANNTLGDSSGTEDITLTVPQLPAHSHAFGYSSSDGASPEATVTSITGVNSVDALIYVETPATILNKNSVKSTGNGTAVNILQPYLVLNSIIKH